MKHEKYSSMTDELLMKQLITDANKQAFTELYDRYAQKLERYCLRMLKADANAEDIVHEIFVKIVEAPKAFDTNQKFSTWIYTIATNLCLNSIRNNQNRDRLLELHYEQNELTTSFHQIDASNLKARINEVFKELTEKEQKVFILRFEHQIPLKEIASILQIPEGSVKSCIFYLLKKLSEKLKPFLR